ncbi:MAG: hypothetical protein L6Q26_09485 [Anaerolineales bacterium]|nr:hypothetical protein [Anaerolineales bacterium]NUQ85018.1 hypothetical protein [Anaerolineales bacterium]
MQNRTIGIVATAVTALLCGCASIFSCVWGFLIATGQPIDVTTNDIVTQQTVSPSVGYVLLCLTVLMLLVPVAVGFFTLRKKPEAVESTVEEIPPAS